jgi:membrane protease subunit HflC
MLIDDDQVAVVSDALSGGTRVVTTPGYDLHLPWWQVVHRLDKSPVEYRLGQKGDSAQLIVRGSDGSSFWFQSVRVRYAVDPARAALVLERSGPGRAFKDGVVDAYARAILRDEFGRFTPEEIVVPDNRHAATARSRARLGEVLVRHGLVVLDLSVSKPSFVKAYETTLERRNTAEQDLERMTRKTQLAREQRQRRLDLIERGAAAQRLQLEHELGLALGAAAHAGEVRIKEVEQEYQQRVTTAMTLAETRRMLAAARVEEIQNRATGLRARADAVAAQGELAVREVLVERLKEIKLVLEPFAAPDTRVERARSAASASDDRQETQR